MTKYRVESRLMDGKKIIAYKLYAGVYVFYVNPEVFSEACDTHLVDSIFSDPCDDLQYEEMLSIRGMTADFRMKYALRNSTVGYLKEELEVVNDMPDFITFDYLFDDTLLATVTLGIKNFEVFVEMDESKNRSPYEFDYWFLRSASHSYPEMLDLLCDYLDRTYMNSRNLIRKIKEYNAHSKEIRSNAEIKFRQIDLFGMNF